MSTEPHSTRDMDRRSFLHAGGGLGGVAFAQLLAREPLLGDGAIRHHAPTAKRVVQLFMSGAASQCDLYDYKPLLEERNGEEWKPGEEVELFQSAPGKVMRSAWQWTQNGE